MKHSMWPRHQHVCKPQPAHTCTYTRSMPAYARAQSVYLHTARARRARPVSSTRSHAVPQPKA
jgi:hypothetical protein